MKIDIHNTFKARGQMADIMSAMLRNSRGLPYAAEFASKFRETVQRPDIAEMHVFLSLADLRNSRASRTLKNQIRRDIVSVVHGITHHGYYLAVLQKPAGPVSVPLGQLATA